MTHAFDALLEVQAHDTRIDQLRHQLEALGSREERDAAGQALAGVDADIADAESARAGLTVQQRRLEDEIESVGARRKSTEDRLYGGSVTNARELQDLQEEVDSLARRIGQLEDQDLELMGQIEPIDARLVELASTRTQRQTVLEDAEVRLTAAEAEIAAALAAAEQDRDALAIAIPDALLSEYRALRTARGGIGVAKLVGTQCGGCHLTLSAVEAARIRKLAEGELTHCEECGRLLVP